MPLTAADWTVTRSNGNIRYIGDDHNGASPSYATVIEFHRWLQELADDAVAVGDDELDITNLDPSRRSTDNIITLIGSYNITDTEAEHLYDGSIIQGTGGTEDIYDGIVNFGNSSVQIQIIQNGAVLSDDWWNYSEGGTHTGGADAAILTDATKTWTNDEWIGYYIHNTTDGSWGLITDNDGTTITATLGNGTDNDWDNGDAYLIAKGLNADSTQGISHRFMVKTRSGGSDIDGRRLIGTTRVYGNTYGEFNINGTARGNNVLALSDSTDLNNGTTIGTVAAISDIYIDRTVSTATVSGVNNTGQAVLNTSDGTQFTAGDFIMVAGDDDEYQILSIATNALTLNHNLAVATSGGEAIYDLNMGYTGLDINNDTTNEFYYAQWDRGSQTINTFYERLKWLSRDGSAEYIYGISGELFRGITHQITVGATRTGTFAQAEPVSWSGGTGQMLAVDSQGTATTMWIQLLTGVAPTDTQVITGGISGATVTVNTTITDRSSLIDTPFVGASTGSALIGSYGLALQAADLTSADTVFDLTNTQITPPNNVTNTVQGLVSGEDRVLVAPRLGTDTNGDPAINKSQLTLDFATNSLTTAAETTVPVTTTIPSDTPSSGTIRVTSDTGFEKRVVYTSWSGQTFNIPATDFSGADDQATGANNVYISYIDELASGTTAEFTSVQSGSRNLVLIVRDGGGTPIKQYIAPWTQTDTSTSTTVIRTTDT